MILSLTLIFLSFFSFSFAQDLTVQFTTDTLPKSNAQNPWFLPLASKDKYIMSVDSAATNSLYRPSAAGKNLCCIPSTDSFELRFGDQMVKIGSNISATAMKNGPDFLFFPQSFPGTTSKDSYLVAILDMDADSSATPLQPHWLFLNSAFRPGEYLCQKPVGTTTNYLPWNAPVFKTEKETHRILAVAFKANDAIDAATAFTDRKFATKTMQQLYDSNEGKFNPVKPIAGIWFFAYNPCTTSDCLQCKGVLDTDKKKCTNDASTNGLCTAEKCVTTAVKCVQTANTGYDNQGKPCECTKDGQKGKNGYCNNDQCEIAAVSCYADCPQCAPCTGSNAKNPCRCKKDFSQTGECAAGSNVCNQLGTTTSCDT